MLKVYYKPNRTNPRYFSACDAARIARQVVNDRNLTPEQVLACIAKGMGFTHISLSREGSQPVEASTISLRKTVNLIKIVVEFCYKLARKTNIKLLIEKIAYILELLDQLDRLINVLQPDQAKVDDVVSEEFCNCKNNP